MEKTCAHHARFSIFVVITIKGYCIQGRNQGGDTGNAEEKNKNDEICFLLLDRSAVRELCG